MLYRAVPVQKKQHNLLPVLFVSGLKSFVTGLKRITDSTTREETDRPEEPFILGLKTTLNEVKKIIIIFFSYLSQGSIFYIENLIRPLPPPPPWK